MPVPHVVEMKGSVKSGVLSDGTARDVVGAGLPLPATVWTRPAAGDTVTVSYSVDGGVNFTTWPSGAVTSFAQEVLVSGVTHIRFQRTAGAGTTSTYGVC